MPEGLDHKSHDSRFQIGLFILCACAIATAIAQACGFHWTDSTERLSGLFSVWPLAAGVALLVASCAAGAWAGWLYRTDPRWRQWAAISVSLAIMAAILWCSGMLSLLADLIP